MGRLKLFGEGQPQGGTTDHSALANLGYAQSGHSGFVPSQGVALVDILRLNQNAIQDSGGNDRITLSTASPHHTLTGDARTTGKVGIHSAVDAAAFLAVSPANQDLTNKMLIKAFPYGGTLGSGTVRGFFAAPVINVQSGGSATAHALEFSLGIGGGAGGATATLRNVYNQIHLVMFQGTVNEMVSYCARQPVILGAPSGVTVSRGIYLQNQGGNAYIADVESLKIDDITLNTGHRYLCEAGPATPYLRLVGGGDPPANKSNLYLKFGSTLYRVVKSGSYMTLEAP